jgi:hypothetical protein
MKKSINFIVSLVLLLAFCLNTSLTFATDEEDSTSTIPNYTTIRDVDK